MAITATASVDPIVADLGAIVRRAARRFGSKPALVTGDRTVTYNELDELCDRVLREVSPAGIEDDIALVALRPTA